MLLLDKAKRRKKRARWIGILIGVLLFIILLLIEYGTNLFARGNDIEADLSRGIDDILGNLNLYGLENFISIFDSSQMGVFGASSITQRLRQIISGDVTIDYGNFFLYILEMIGVNLLRFLPIILGILAIAICMNLIGSLKGKFASESVGKIVSFSGVALVSAILAVQVVVVIGAAQGLINSIRTQMNIAFPLILTLMAGAGGVQSAAIYQPAVAILGGGIISILSVVVVPLFIITNALTIVGNLSDAVKLKNMSSFFISVTKWVLGTAFFLFIAFLSVQGITASVHDGVSVRTARFAISRYVPIIGGYLSEGFNLVMAGSVLVKNAVGLVSILILLLTAVPIIVSCVVFSLSLKLTAAITEPLGDKRISNIVLGVSKNMIILIAILIAAVFLYLIFLLLTIATGNLAL